MLTEATDWVSDGSTAAPSVGGGEWKVAVFDAVQRMDVKRFACDVNSVPIVEKTESASNAQIVKATTAKPSSKSGKGKGKKSSSLNAPATATSNNKKSQSQVLPPITDETVLQTLCVTLKSEGLYDTMSELYHQAVITLSSQSHSNAEKSSVEQRNAMGEVLEEAVCVHFKAVCDCDAVVMRCNDNNNMDINNSPSDGSDSTKDNIVTAQSKSKYTLQQLQTQHRVVKYYERMQSTALQLAKHTGESLHFQWTAVASLWYRESLEVLVNIMQYFHGWLNDDADGASEEAEETIRVKSWLVTILELKTVEDIPSKCASLRQTMGLLPRLAESLSYRMIQNKSQKDDVSNTSQTMQYASETDWDLYLETLLVQDKFKEALDALRNIPCSLLNGEGINNNNDNNSTENHHVLPQIHDEDTIENHVGTILPFTQRKKLEQMSQMALKLGSYKEAEGWFRELLLVFPDQWTYWMGLIDSCVVIDGVLCEEGWEGCRSFAEEIADAHSGLRGPHLISVELAAVKVRHFSDGGTGGKGELMKLLRKAICEYGDKFSPIASCCFADLRPYLEVLVSFNGGMSEEVSLAMNWAKGLWMIHTQSSSNGGASEAQASPEELRERRKNIRTFIFAIQVCFCISAELGKAKEQSASSGGIPTLVMESLHDQIPSIQEMISEWRASLTFLPGVPPKDGGQKETLPGDEIVLLIAQYLQLEASCNTAANPSGHQLLIAASLLEEAIEQSPYNASLKIAAIGVYSRLKAAHRAYEHYQDMGVKCIQLDSCSYLIVPTLIEGGLYTQAIQLSSSLLRFHGSTSKDIKEYSTKSFRKGYLLKSKEMVAFQRQNMRPSIQLLQAKGLVMDCAALLNASDMIGTQQKSEIRLGAEKGLCGCDEDLSRAEQLVRDAEGHFNAPSIIHSSSNATCARDLNASDNRDLTVNSFEILFRSEHYLSAEDVANGSLLRGYTQCLMIYAVMATDAAKAPKKGKVPKNTAAMLARCKSLSNTLAKARIFVEAASIKLTEVEISLWEAMCFLCEVIAAVIQGSGGADPSDTLAEREQIAVAAVQLATSSISKALTSLSSSSSDDVVSSGGVVCKALPDRIVPLFAIIETTSRLFALFGWGKRKRTKETATALANLALLFKDLILEMSEIMRVFNSFESPKIEDVPFDIRSDCLHAVVKCTATSREMTTDRVDPFLKQMAEALETYANDEP